MPLAHHITPRVVGCAALAWFALACSCLSSLAEETCKLTPTGTVEVAAVRDGRTLLLKDGRELRLAAIEVTEQSRAALEALAAGQMLRLEKLGPDRDRYGRVVAFAFPDGATVSLQHALVAQGAARVSARIEDKRCAAPLLAAEQEARSSRRGLWADPNFAPLPADDLPRLKAGAGRFALVEGKVLSVHTSGSTIYLNFGRHWTRDFAVFIPRRLLAGFAAADTDPRTLEGRKVRVRGFIEERRGPVIEAELPAQIELID